MARRKDGHETRDRILEVACEIFAEKGFRDARVEEICKRASANIAAVNYHFGSKDKLYAQVWRHAFDAAMEAYPPDGGLEPEAPAPKRLRAAIYALLGKCVNPGSIGHAGKLLLREMVNPTDVINQVKHDAIRPLHNRMNRLMRDLLGPKASGEQVLMCQMSIVHQCLGVGIGMFTGRIPPHARLDVPTDRLLETLTDHIARFSLAGVKALRKDIESRRA